jgi:hypothetical protein
MSRKMQWLLLSITVLLVVPTQAFAFGCWQCPGNYDTCIYYRQGDLGDCRLGCNGNAACLTQCQNQYNAGVAQCGTERQWCYDNCEGDKPVIEKPKEVCPVIVDLGQNNFELSSADDGVAFDIDADGVAEVISWTAAGAADGFLVFDRNQNGIVDSGAELFGNVTVQAPSDNPNGFLALAALDGNGDGLISSIDGIFGGLQIWVDANHDGRTDAGELSSLEANGIVAIELDYRESRRRDRYGNELRYRTRVQLEDGHTDAIDVFFILR